MNNDYPEKIKLELDQKVLASSFMQADLLVVVGLVLFPVFIGAMMLFPAVFDFRLYSISLHKHVAVLLTLIV